MPLETDLPDPAMPYFMMSDDQLLLEFYRRHDFALNKLLERWQGLGRAWATLPAAMGGTGWLAALSFAHLMPEATAWWLGGALAFVGLALGSWRLHRIERIPLAELQAYAAPVMAELQRRQALAGDEHGPVH
jgi:hypothetical protein